eukprot:5566438-Pleurochrysis_carterae.AAC.1
MLLLQQSPYCPSVRAWRFASCGAEESAFSRLLSCRAQRPAVAAAKPGSREHCARNRDETWRHHHLKIKQF